MHRLRTHRLPYGWIALAAFLFGLFAPVLSHAGAAPPLTLMTEVCSASGTKHLPLVLDAAPGQAVPDLSHCDLCCAQHEVFGPPPRTLPVRDLDRARDPMPQLFYHAPTPQFAWTPARSRAPPFIAS
jgi:hypothetical protein